MARYTEIELQSAWQLADTQAVQISHQADCLQEILGEYRAHSHYQNHWHAHTERDKLRKRIAESALAAVPGTLRHKQPAGG